MKLTVICVFQNQKDNIEPTLTALYEAEGYPFEVVVINDASNDQSRDVIQSLYDYYQHEHTFILDHEEPHGKGNCLNEATQLASGQVIWIVDRIDKVHVDILKQEVDRLIESPALCTLMGAEHLPDEIEGWIEQINNSRLLSNENYLWKWKSVPNKQRFFNPYQSDFHSTEAAIRISGRDKMILGETCFVSKSTMGRMAGISSNRAEILISLFRERKLSIEQADLLMSQLKLKEKKLTVDTNSRSMGELLDEARAFLHEGYNIDALEICNKLLDKYPDNLEVLTLKVQVLNRMKRYVEAAEIKHSIQQRYGVDLNIPKAGERRPTDRPVDESSGDVSGVRPMTLAAVPIETPTARMNQLLTKPPDGSAPPVAPPPMPEPSVIETPSFLRHGEPVEAASHEQTPLEFEDAELDVDYDFPEPIPISREQEARSEKREQEQEEPVDDMAGNWVDDGGSQDEGGDLSYLEDDKTPHDISDLNDALDTSDALDASVLDAPEPDALVASDTPDALVSVVIVTASDRKEMLQQCLISIAEHVDPANIEIIVVDNASLDDTFDYLDQLEGNEHFRFKAITNKENKGFAEAANQGMDAANGDYLFVIHNDVVLHDDSISLMVDQMVANPDIAILGPVLSDCYNQGQTPDVVDPGEGLTETDYLDSACMMIRASSGLRFDTAYGLAWFEDRDICKEAQGRGHRVAIVNAAFIEHIKGTTTDDLGLEYDSKIYWNNKASFDRKWNLMPIPGAFYSEDPIMELVAIGTYLNPWHPEPSLIERARQLLTSETRTQIHKTSWDYDSIAGIMQLLMVVESRDLLRHLEDKLTAFELKEPLCYRLVSYYYDRSIYSRCAFYLSELADDKVTFRLRLLRLRIAVNERKSDIAIPMIQELFNYSPSNPEIMRLLGELHKHEGNYEDAEQCYRQAKQTDPISYAHLRV
jgi:glycosyltransferase involved in cell wall biosynthesis